MALTRMTLNPTGLRPPPPYSSISAEALSARFLQIHTLLLFVAACISFLLAFFLNTTWLRSIFSIVFRAIPISISLFVVPVLRKAHLHVDYLRYASMFAEYLERFRSKVFVHALATYLFSSYLFFWAYHFQVANLGLTTPSSYGHPLLNERYVYYYLFFPSTLGTIAAVLHVALDIDRISFRQAALFVPPKQRVYEGTFKIVQISSLIAVAGSIVLPVLYYLARPFFWTILVSILRSFVKLHPSQTRSYSGFPVNSGLWFHTFFLILLLSFSWIFTNMVFGIYMSMAPKSRGDFLSSKSSDRNGTLIDGLSHRERQLNCILAYLELASISRESEVRRRQLFEDIEYKPIAWERVKNELLRNLSEVTKKLKKKDKKSLGSAASQDKNKIQSNERNKQQLNEDAGVITIKSSNVFAHTNRRQTHLIESIQDKEAKSSLKFVSLFDVVSVKVREFVKTYPKALEIVTRSRYGYPFRFTLARQVHRIVPNYLLTSAGIYSLGQLIVHSREEDRYGVVQGSIPEILDKLLEALQDLEKYIQNPPKHWSDQEGTPLGKGGVETEEQKKKRREKDAIALTDMIEVYEVVETQINDIITTFWTNMDDLKLSNRVRDYIESKTNEHVLNESVYYDRQPEMVQLD